MPRAQTAPAPPARAVRSRKVAIEGVVMGTVPGEAVLSSLRRLAHVDASARLDGTGGDEERGTGPAGREASDAPRARR